MNIRFEFNRLTALPAAGGAMGESAVTPTTQPSFQRTGVYMKVVRRKGATTNFLKDASKKMYDAVATNIEATLLSHVYDMENYIMYGNAGANTYEFSGLDTFITTNRTNQVVGGVVPTNLNILDSMIDANMDYQGIDHKKAFVMSPQMLSKYSQLLTNVRLNQGLSGALSQVDVPGGWRLNAYRDVPIIVSSACRPRSTMGNINPTVTDDTGTVLDSQTYYFKVAAVTINGEQLASAEVSQATGTGGAADAHSCVLSFTPVTGAYRYKVYTGTVSGTLYLKWVAPGFVYDANGTIAASSTQIVTAGGLSISSNASGQTNVITINSTPTTAGSMVPTALQSDLPLVATGGIAPEYMFLWDLDEYQGLGALPYTNEGGARFNGLVTIEDLAVTDDFLPFLIKSYCALADSFESTSSIVRGLRVE